MELLGHVLFGFAHARMIGVLSVPVGVMRGTVEAALAVAEDVVGMGWLKRSLASAFIPSAAFFAFAEHALAQALTPALDCFVGMEIVSFRHYFSPSCALASSARLTSAPTGTCFDTFCFLCSRMSAAVWGW